MLHYAKLPKMFWGEAIITTNYLQNRSPIKALNDKTPYEVWMERKPNLDVQLMY